MTKVTTTDLNGHLCLHWLTLMADSDSDSVGSAAHVSKARKGADGHVAKLWEQFEPSIWLLSLLVGQLA